MEETRREEKKAMIAIDESDCSHFALEWALSNLKHNLNSGGLLLFTVIPVDYGGLVAGSYGTAPSMLPAPELITSIQENQKRFAIALLEKAKNLCAKHGVDAETLYVFGNPNDAICEAVEKYHVQLLILGSNGKGALKRALLGSVSNYCANNAKCPVMVVRKPPA